MAAWRISDAPIVYDVVKGKSMFLVLLKENDMFEPVEQPINPPELTDAEREDVEAFARARAKYIDDTITDRMRDTDWVKDSITRLIEDDPFLSHVADLIMRQGDVSIHIGNLRIACMEYMEKYADLEFLYKNRQE